MNIFVEHFQCHLGGRHPWGLCYQKLLGVGPEAGWISHSFAHSHTSQGWWYPSNTLLQCMKFHSFPHILCVCVKFQSDGFSTKDLMHKIRAWRIPSTSVQFGGIEVNGSRLVECLGTQIRKGGWKMVGRFEPRTKRRLLEIWWDIVCDIWIPWIFHKIFRNAEHKRKRVRHIWFQKHSCIGNQCGHTVSCHSFWSCTKFPPYLSESHICHDLFMMYKWSIGTLRL